MDLREEIEVDVGGKRAKGVKEIHEVVIVVMRDERVDDGVAGEKDMSGKRRASSAWAEYRYPNFVIFHDSFVP